ncbi:hypothetical protein OAD02_06315 [Alphaproteobacteria bacterium]|nr:hypothetical protein [Alphaproteobacteria bacterium]
MKIGVFIPIRLGSERLPEKCLKIVQGKTILEHLIDRVCKSQFISSKEQIVICTTNEPENNKLIKVLNKLGLGSFRGEKDDIIKRFYDANQKNQFDIILQIDGDDPLITPEYCDAVIEAVCNGECEVASTSELPFGLNVKAFSAQALSKVFSCYKTFNNETGFGLYFLDRKICQVKEIKTFTNKHICPDVRLTLDYPDDLKLISKVIKLQGEYFSYPYSLDKIIEILTKNPEFKKINWYLQEKHLSRSHKKVKLTYVADNILNKVEY